MMEIDVSSTSISDGEGGIENHRLSDPALLTSDIGGSKLKRSCSAPMIPHLINQLPSSAPPTPSASCCDSLSSDIGIQPRMRRLSASFSPVSPLSPGSLRSSGRFRVCQLREEEGMDVSNREVAHENKLHSSLTLSQSWEDLALTEDKKSNYFQLEDKKSFSSLSNQSKSYGELSLMINQPVASSSNSASASPTRVGRQCFSPSLQQHVRNYTFCTSPSPTKKTFTTFRPLSPIPLRPSSLGGLKLDHQQHVYRGGIKRKSDVEESFATPSKRLSVSGPFEKCGLLMPQRSLQDPLVSSAFRTVSESSQVQHFEAKQTRLDSSEEMITDSPMQLNSSNKSYQEMDLSESVQQESL